MNNQQPTTFKKDKENIIDFKIEDLQTDNKLFVPSNLEEGKHQVVGFCNGYTTEQRWEVETEVFSNIIINQLTPDMKVLLDYGCGVGRISKAILDKNKDIKIIGVDTSQQMLDVAKEYVNSDRFITKTPQEFNDKVDFAICIYVLQHIPEKYLLPAITQLVNSSDTLLLSNSVCRMAVSDQGFVNDNIDVLSLISNHFKTAEWAIPAKVLIENMLIRKMFMGSVVAGPEGNSFHYSFIFSK